MFRRLPFLLALIQPLVAQTPAFPGAEGYGAYAKGGRGGDVYVVTNLNASGAGSFRNGIETVPAAGRTIVFAVSGHIPINGLRLTGSKVTIAGQTAPGDGVGLINGTFRISGDDVIVRHLRVRHRKSGSGGDCINLDSGSINSVLDSISMQFSTDENFSSFGSPPENLTMQWSLNAWGLVSHSAGGLWDQNHATCHHSLWAHNHTRNPKARPNGLLEWINNVTFDWNIGFIMGDSATPAGWKANVQNSYFLCPPGNLRSRALEKANLDRNGNPNFSLYLNNCRHDNDGDGLLNGTDKGYGIASGNYITLAAPFPNTGAIPVNMDDPVVAFKKVVSKAGALRLDIDPARPLRDEVDTRLIQNLVTQTRNHITSEANLAGISNGGIGTLNATPAPLDADRDGMPDIYELSLGWNPAVQDHNTVLPNSGGLLTGTTFMPAGTVAGYTRLEEYLHFLAIPHGTVAKNIAGSPTSVQVDLKKFTSGFSSSPVFAISNIVGGTIAQSGTGNSTATFTPTLNFVGRARFDFTVTDSAGHAWTQTCALLVTNSGLPRDLEWQGGLNSNAWDGSTNNWLRNGATTAFSFGDRVSFDESGSKSPAISISGAVSPGSVDFDATGNYTLSGSGDLISSGPLTKRGAGNLVINNTGTNSFSAIALDAGNLALNTPSAGGTGPISFNGGSLSLAPANNTSNSNPFEFNRASIITVGSQHTQTGNWTGSQNVTVNATSSQLWTIAGTWTGFTGRLLAGTGNPRFRLNGTTNVNFGSAAVAVDLGTGTAQLMNRNGATIEIGELSSTGSSTVLSGSQSGTAASTYNIGGLNTDATFAGVISNGGGSTHISKVGTATWTLAGISTYTGTTSVSQGALLVDGALGNSAVTVSSGALLGGDGVLGGSVTANAGAILSPGTIPFTAATMSISGGLNLNGNTLYYDMSNSPTGANDKISVGGTLALTGAQTFQFVPLQGSLAEGTYDLITAATSSASGVSLLHNLPTDSRQSFSLARSAAGSIPSKVWLTVTGNPATLTWTGNTNGNWDTVTVNNWSGASPNTYYSNDDVIFSDSAATRSVTLVGSLAPRGVSINTSLGYTFTGAGSIDGNASLTKSGSSTLTFSNSSANSFSGGLVLNAGTITLTNDTLNAGGLGTGTVTLNGGVISMHNNSNTYNNFNAALLVPNGAAARLNADSRVDIHGCVSGGGTLNYYTPWVRATLFADWSAFSGILNVLTDSSGGDLRMGTSYSYPGFPNALVALTDRVWFYYAGTLSEGAGTTIPIGALSGTALSTLQGGATGGRALTYRIGGRNTDAVFAGTISEQNSGTATNYIKTGTGTWTLGGNGSWNGGLAVEQGTLKLTGPFACAGATQIHPGARFLLEGGNLTTEAISLAIDATLQGWGSVTADLNAEGTIEGMGFTSGSGAILSISGNAYLGADSITRLRAGASGDRIDVDGDLALDGTLQVSLAAGTGFGRYRLLSSTGEITGTLSLAGIPAGMVAKLSTSVAGGVDLVMDDQDEDNMPDSWEITHFGNIQQTPGSDSDGDGTTNLAEYRLNLNPANGASAFRASLSGRTIVWPSAPGLQFVVKISFSLDGENWDAIATVTGGNGSTASYTDPDSFTKAFYRVEFQP